MFVDLLRRAAPFERPVWADPAAGRRTADGALAGVLNETGFLGRLLPDWARIVGQMQFDTYHVFTVDEHTIEAVRILNQLDRGDLAEIAPIASGLVENLQSRRALYVAACCCTTSPRGAAATIPRLGAELALEIGPTARPGRPRRPRRSPGWCCTTCC